MYEITLSKKSNTILLPNVQLTGPANTLESCMILDTGADFSLITWNEAVLLGYNPEEGRPVSIITGNGLIQTPLILLESITLGDVCIKNMPTICHDIQMGEARGLIGLGFLKHTRTVIDYKTLRLEVS